MTLRHLSMLTAAMVALTMVALHPRSEAAEAPTPPPQITTADAKITVSPKQWGVSTRYIGGTEGNSRFNIDDLIDCGINTLRIYGDMSRFEPTDDGGVYGAPSIADIQAKPDVIPWKRWDEIMDSSNAPTVPDLTWRSIFKDLRRANITTVISLRNRDTSLHPAWIAAVPKTEADWNEWWEYVFAFAYWLNVRNDFRVDDFEVLNEPDNTPQQGWIGTREEYCEMVRKTKDALDYLYRTYLPGRTYHLHAPVTAAPDWVPGVLADAGNSFDSLNVHWYAWWDKGEFVRKMHQHLADSGHPGYQIWLSEWGTYDVSYDETYMGLAVVENLIRFSRPGNDHVYGSHIFSFYNWVYDGQSGWGVVAGDGTRRATYYALRLAIRALAGEKPTFQATTEAPDLSAIATKEADGRINLLVVNWSDKVSYNLTADLPGLMSAGNATIRQFSATVRDEVVGQAPIEGGKVCFAAPPWSAVLVTCRKVGDSAR